MIRKLIGLLGLCALVGTANAQNFRDGSLIQGQAFKKLAKKVAITADDTSIVVGKESMIELTSNSASASARTFTLSNSPLGAGHELFLYFASGSSYTAQLADSGTMKLISVWEPLQYDWLHLISDGTNWNEVGRGGSSAVTDGVGQKAKRLAVAKFDATGGKDIAAHGLGVSLPDNAIVTGMWYEVITTFTSATDAATIALHVQSANDLVSAVAISNGGNPWDAALPVEGVPKIETTSTWIKTSAVREITATVASEALTAGVLYVFIEYIVSE